MSQGFLGFVGIGKESQWGTAVSATDYTELFSENIGLTKDRYELKNAHGRFFEPDDAAGLDRVAGDLVVPGFPIVAGQLLRGALNTMSASVVLSGMLWTTRFITTKSEFAAGVPSQPFTFEVFRDVTSSFQYSGVLVNRLQIAVAPNQPLRLSANVLAKAAALMTKSSPTFVSSPTYPFTFDAASIQVGGSATARLEAMTITIDNQLDGIPALNNTSQIARIQRRGFQMVRVQGTYNFEDVAEFLDFKNQTERAMVLSFTKADSFAVVFDMPRVVYTAFAPNIAGKERLTVQFDGMARFSTTSDLALDCRLTCTKSNF